MRHALRPRTSKQRVWHCQHHHHTSRQRTHSPTIANMSARAGELSGLMKVHETQRNHMTRSDDNIAGNHAKCQIKDNQRSMHGELIEDTFVHV